MLELGADVNAGSMTSLMWACCKGNLELARLLLTHHASKTATDHDGKTAYDHVPLAWMWEDYKVLTELKELVKP